MNNSVRKIFKNLDAADATRYASYWGNLAAKDDKEFFQRFLFAFCSVHTTWESNVRGYAEIKDYEAWLSDKTELRRRLIASRCGLHNNRTEYIYGFAEKFWADPAEYRRGDSEPWWMYRDRLERRIKGLGLAKTSYALEMAFPLECDVVCFDVHMLRLYGDVDAGRDPIRYEKFEDDWVKRAKKLGVAPYIARNVYWDKLQGKQDSRYWSAVLEN